jgi:hypothetical protein
MSRNFISFKSGISGCNYPYFNVDIMIHTCISVEKKGKKCMVFVLLACFQWTSYQYFLQVKFKLASSSLGATLSVTWPVEVCVCVCVVSIAMRRGWWWLWHVEAVSVRKQKKRVRVMKNRTIGLTTEPHLDPPIVVVTFGCCHDGVCWPYAQSCNNNARAFKKSWIKKNTPDASRAPCCCCGIWWQLLAQACK